MDRLPGAARRWLRRRPLAATFALLLALRAGTRLPAAESGTDLVSVPRYTHPGAGQVFYFVLTDRFSNGSTANDTGGIAGGPDVSGFDPTRISHFHGGDLVGLTSKLDYIKGLGATAIWITPPFRNKPMQEGTAGYHGYWILDFTTIDPHLGTGAEFRDFVGAAHARGLRVYLDIVVNHTADVIKYRDGNTTYVDMATSPYRDAAGRPFSPHDVAYNGVGPGDDFPRLSAATSFPHVPYVRPGDEHAKGPDWLNDPTLYHNRGDSRFTGENSLFGDFVGLDDLFTEDPAVVRGFIDIYTRWMERYGIDGYRIDTVKHVNLEFWEAFGAAIRQKATDLGRPDFLEFGEVNNGNYDYPLMSEFSTTGNLDGTLDFAFYDAARAFVSRGQDASALASVFSNDSWYTGHDTSAQEETTFVSNHDDGRLGLFLKEDNPKADAAQMEQLLALGQALLLTVRGQPAIYYGDEQGMVGTGNDMGAREDMFPSRAAPFMGLARIGTTALGTADKFDTGHPIYRLISTLSALRDTHPAFSRGAMIVRDSHRPRVFAFSRIERGERVEYLVALNNSRTDAETCTLPTSQPGGARFRRIFDTSGDPAPRESTTRADGSVSLVVAPLELLVLQAQAPLPMAVAAPSIHFTAPGPGATLAFTTRSIAGHVIPVRQELRAEVSAGDDFGEVTFVMRRASRPGQSELLGTADAPPYRVYWRPPADLAQGETLEFLATVDDLRGHRSSDALTGVHVAPSSISFGIKGATVPVFTRMPASPFSLRRGGDLDLAVSATGTPPLSFEWIHDGRIVPGAGGPVLRLVSVGSDATGTYVALARNREGTAVSRETQVIVAP